MKIDMELFWFILVTIAIIVPIVAYGGICFYKYIFPKKGRLVRAVAQPFDLEF